MEQGSGGLWAGCAKNESFLTGSIARPLEDTHGATGTGLPCLGYQKPPPPLSLALSPGRFVGDFFLSLPLFSDSRYTSWTYGARARQCDGENDRKVMGVLNSACPACMLLARARSSFAVPERA